MRRRTVAGGLKPLLCLAAAVGLLGLQACATYQVTVPDSDPLRPEYKQRTMHAYFWGMLADPEVLAADCQGQGINDVVVAQSFAHDLAGVLTFGIWMPVEVRYRCKAPPIQGGTFPRRD